MPTLHFKGKPLVQNHHLVVPLSELEAVKSRGLSKPPSLHDNLIIEGDNLKALKALLPTYHGKVKCIYIDPPYNTGNEGWIYNDRVNSPMIRDWLGKTVDRDDLTRHDKWCCMMLPRLKLLRELLTDDGAIFVSIDDNEVHHLRALMDEVFGENDACTFVWKSRVKPSNIGDAKFKPQRGSEYVLMYAVDPDRLRFSPFYSGEERKYPHTDSKGRYRLQTILKSNRGENVRTTMRFPIAGYTPPPDQRWQGGKAFIQGLHDTGYIEYRDGTPFRKYYEGEEPPEHAPLYSLISSDISGTAESGKLELNEILGNKHGLDTVKPTGLLRYLLQSIAGPEDVVLDSFAGSGTTAHAVLALNKEDGGNRRFILCQMPYETKEQEQKKQNLCETITAERVRRVIKGVKGAKNDSLREGLGGTFSYFKLGKELRKQAILDGKDLPSYEALAGYVFFTATADEFDPKKMKPPFIGTSRECDVFLVYERDIEKLKDMALNLDLARKLGKAERKKLVFAPTKYLDQEYLDRLNIEFCQLPFEIYQRATKK
jgi:adenine-specific DNA-methyltransferase